MKQARAIKGLIFDKDGTLFHFGKTWGPWCRAVLADLTDGDDAQSSDLADAVGYHWASAEFIEGSPIVNGAADEVMQIWKEKLPSKTIHEIAAVCEAQIQNVKAHPVCDLQALSHQLKQSGYRLGIATNDHQAAAEMQLKDAQIWAHFASIIGCDSGHGAKPDPGQILWFANEMGLHPSETAMIGDSTHDLHAGRAAGVGMTIGVLTGPARRETLAPLADLILPDIGHLPDVFSSPPRAP